MAQHDTVTCNVNGKENAQKQRRKNIHYLILSYLQDEGYTNTSNSFIQEAKLTNDIRVCDNIDLDIILQDFTSYYLLKFNKQPLICKRNSEPEKTTANIGIKKSKGKQKINKDVSKQEENNVIEDPFIVVTPLISQNQDIVNKNMENVHEVLDAFEIKPFGNFIKNLSQEYKEIAENINYSARHQHEAITWREIAGLENATKHLREATIFPLKYPHMFQGLMSPWSGILLFGPPGSGKTLLVKALAHEYNRTFFNISASVIVSKWRGESEKYIKILFDLAKYYSPSVIFMDEFDALTSRRDSNNEHEASKRLKHELLIELDGLNTSKETVLFLATTNLPWEVDSAILRRLEKRIFIPLPGEESREKMFNMFLNDTQCKLSVDIKKLSAMTEGYSGSDIRVICKEAAMKNIRNNIYNLEKADMKYKYTLYTIQQEDLVESISKIKPTASDLMGKYIKWADTLGAE